MMKFIRPEFFDIFGVFVFTIIAFLSGRSIMLDMQIPHWGLLFLFLVSLAGIVVDGTIVYKTYISKE